MKHKIIIFFIISIIATLLSGCGKPNYIVPEPNEYIHIDTNTVMEDVIMTDYPQTDEWGHMMTTKFLWFESKPFKESHDYIDDIRDTDPTIDDGYVYVSEEVTCTKCGFHYVHCQVYEKEPGT